MPCYRIRSKYHLGDRWSRLNYALRLLERGERFSLFVEQPFAREIYDSLAIAPLQPALLPKEPADWRESRRLIYHISGERAYGCSYFPTIQKHNPIGDVIGFALDANWRKSEKVPPGIESTLDLIRNVLPGYTLVPIGKPYQTNVTQLITSISQLKLLISVDNGVAHVARSVGVPLFLLEHLLPVSRGFPEHCCNYTRVTNATLLSHVLAACSGGPIVEDVPASE